MKVYNSKSIELIEDLLNIGIALSAEEDHNKLLELILTEARKITNADAGTLYLYEDDKLSFKLMQNDTLEINKGGRGEEIDLPPVELNKENVSAYVALTKETVNIADVYDTDKFDFSGPKKYDQMTNYRTKSMLVLPLEDYEGNVIGVLQLINAQDDKKDKVIPFKSHLEKVVGSLASQAAVSLSNVQAKQEIEELLNSFVEVMATAVDARTPYNAAHTKRLAAMIKEFMDLINGYEEGKYADEYFDDDRRQELIMTAWLHDIGKVAIPLEVMNKATRLEDKLELVEQRFDYIAAVNKLSYYKKKEEGRLQLKEELAQIEEARELVNKANNPNTFVDEEMQDELAQIAKLTYVDETGTEQPWLTDDELQALSVAKGTLTSEEREEMEDHVQVAVRILKAIPFPERLDNIPNLVSMHHEFLDGSGYPRGLEGDEIPLEIRILTVVDIFDSLAAADRPYKDAKSVDEALGILDSMIEEGKLDEDVVRIFREEELWQVEESDRDYQIW